MSIGTQNVVWITLDSVRTDHTGLAGYERDTTPTLDRLADEGAGFRNCFAHSNATLRSSASILTGTYPSHHTVGMGNSRLPEEATTVPERLREAGYTTACLSRNSHLSEATGLDRGFDRFDWLASSTLLDVAGVRTTARYLRNIRRHSAGFTPDAAKHATPFLMNDVAGRWLDDLADEEPFFLYMHYNEPHRPFYPPLPYLDRYIDDIAFSAEEAAAFAMDVHRNCLDYIADGLPFSDDEWDALTAMYDAEIAYTDRMVGELIETVRETVPGDTAFVVTADHGELFGEGGMLAHRLVLHDAVLRVPLVVAGLDVEGDDRLVQHADVMQTLVERAGGRTEGLQGVPLNASDREHVIAQRGPVDLDPYRSRNAGFDADRYPPSALHAISDGSFKYVESDSDGRLFELPDEETDASAAHPEEREALAGRLHDWLDDEGQPVGTGGDAAFTDAMERQLRDLGYVE